MKKLRVGRFLISTDVNGPGSRFVIWFQGCPLRCSDCFNPEFWDETKGVLVDIEEIIAHIKSKKDIIEGVTFTGGEPLIQAEQILPLAKMIKENGLSIVCYTGYLLQDIVDNKLHYARDLLKFVDIFIDGKYIEEEKAPLLWRGSRNQKVYFLTNRYKHLQPSILKEGKREAELKIGENRFVMTGIFDMEFWEKLKKEVGKK